MHISKPQFISTHWAGHYENKKHIMFSHFEMEVFSYCSTCITYRTASKSSPQPPPTSHTAAPTRSDAHVLPSPKCTTSITTARHDDGDGLIAAYRRERIE